MTSNRRSFLAAGAAAAAGAALPPAIARALDLPASGRTGTIADLEHVVIFMQENRSFDHYFGTLHGVRGFGDPRALNVDYRSVFNQPVVPGSTEVLSPFHLDGATSNVQGMKSLDHSWKGSHDRWKLWDAWIPAKTPLTMGYLTRDDIPFHHALADAFTICDAYHCSIFGPTNPNRMFLFTGTSGLAAGYDGPNVVDNPPDEPNEAADPARDNHSWPGFGWTTYAERLEAAGVSWRVYQEWDNYGDNALAYFANFRDLDPASPLYQKGRAGVSGSTELNAKSEAGQHLVAAFSADVAADRLPQVSWIVAPYPLCEHPSATPADGEALTARLIAALTANPVVWAKTAFILTYDENDGFFDHMPAPTPPAGSALGKSTVSLDGELYHGEPVGLGPRVPTIVVSPWTKGGWVSSQLLDHTSIIRLLETRFGVREPNITPWRRTVCGDLAAGVFDFAVADATSPVLPDASLLPAQASAQASLPAPRAPAPRPLTDLDALQRHPGRAVGRPARPLPYDVDAWARVSDDHSFELTISNSGASGAAFALYSQSGGEPRFYAVEPGKVLTERLRGDGANSYDLHGPNGFFRRFALGARIAAIEVTSRVAGAMLEITLRNVGPARAIALSNNSYAIALSRRFSLAPGEVVTDRWDVSASDHWYGVDVWTPDDQTQRLLYGHIETGRASRSDPQLRDAWSPPWLSDSTPGASTNG